MVSKNPPWKRHYKKEAAYEDTPQQVRDRELRNKARAQLTKTRGKSIPHSLDVAHVVSVEKGGTDRPRNLRIETIKRNRSWRKGQKGYHVPKDI